MKPEILKKLHDSQIKILDEISRICKENNLQYFLTGGTLLGAIRHKGFIPWDDDLDIAMPREYYEKFIDIAKESLGEDFILDDIKTNKDYWLIFSKVRLKNTLLESGFDEKEEYKGNKGIWVDIFPLDSTVKEKKIFKDKIIKILKAVYLRKSKYIKNNKHKKLKLFEIIFKPLSMEQMNKIIKRQMIAENKKDTPYFINFGSQYGIKKQTHLKEKYFPLIDVEFEGKKYKAPNDYNYVLTKIYGSNYMKLPPVEKRITHNPIKIKFEDGQEVVFDKGDRYGK